VPNIPCDLGNAQTIGAIWIGDGRTAGHRSLLPKSPKGAPGLMCDIEGCFASMLF